MRRTTGIAALGVGAVLVSLAVPMITTANANEPRGRASWCTGPEVAAERIPQRFHREECPIQGLVIRDRSLGVGMPAPGKGVTIWADPMVESARNTTLEVRQSADGYVTVSGVGDDVDDAGELPSDPMVDEGQAVSPTYPISCSDGSFYDTVKRQGDRWTWYLNTSTVPSNIAAGALDAIKAGVNSMANGYNDCGRPTDFSRPWTYAGNTSRFDGASSDSETCPGANQDGYNVVTFGYTAGHLAVACAWDGGDNEIETADIRFRSMWSWTTTHVGCSGLFDLWSVAAHEAGHVFGLKHSAEGTLTMSPSVGKCEFDPRTLGWGDYYIDRKSAQASGF